MGISYRQLPKSENVRGIVIAVFDDNHVIGEITRVENGFQYIPLGAKDKPELCSEIKTSIEDIKKILGA
jgi:hypothetical protein